MAMDFFEHQEQARRKTGRLVLMFITAVVCIIALCYLVVAIAFMFLNQPKTGQGPGPTLWNPMLLLTIGSAVIAIVACGSLFKISQLAAGGRVVAESLGGRLLDTGASDPGERKLLNVVEEMAIASGVPVPNVYVMDNEKAINAFAAGFGPDDAVIGVTRGCIDLLDRDELQGVIAHEFSHILNGDMRLNLRLIGVLFGILVIGLIGRMVLSSMRFSGGGRSRSGKNEGAAILVILGAGLALMVIGYMGFFFGGLIKSAVSRQREFLADASAVQFTRYPEGISGALKKIGGYSFGSRVLNPHADEVSHMFFSQGVANALGGLGATHPPLDQRISRIEPRWDGKFPEVSTPKRVDEKLLKKQVKLARGEARKQAIGALAAMGAAGAMTEQTQAAPAIQQVGQPTEAHVERAQDLLGSIPAMVKEATHSSMSAAAVIYAMLLSSEPDVRTKQIDAIREIVDPPTATETVKLGSTVEGLDRSVRLPLIDMTMPALHNLSSGQYRAFKDCVSKLIDADQKVDLFEWMLSRVLMRRLAPEFEPEKRTRQRVKYYSLKPVRDHLAVLLSTLARSGHEDRASAEHAFNQGMGRLPLDPAPKLLDAGACGLRQIDEALTELDTVGPREKKAVINACAVCVTADSQVTAVEAELLRAVCDSLGCPMPPLLPGQALV